MSEQSFRCAICGRAPEDHGDDGQYRATEPTCVVDDACVALEQGTTETEEGERCDGSGWRGIGIIGETRCPGCPNCQGSTETEAGSR